MLFHEAKEHQQSDSAIDVDRHTEGHENEKPGRQAQRQRRHDRQWVDKTIELRCKNHVDKHDRQKDSDTEIAGGLCQLLCAASKDDAVTRLHVQFSGLLAHCRNSLSKGNSIQAGIDLNISLSVVSLNIVRSGLQFELGHVAQLDWSPSCRWNQLSVQMGRIPQS